MSAEPDATNPYLYRDRARAIVLSVKGIPGKDDSILDLALTLTETLALGDLDPDRAGRLAAAHALATNLVTKLNSDRTEARERGLDRASALEHELAGAWELVVGRRRVASPVADVTDDHSESHSLAAPDTASDAAKRPEPLASARRLLAIAVRLLPETARTRYEEEFRSELAELTTIGSGRWAQLTYGTRLVLRVWQLRTALKAPRRRGAVQ
jgi:hypothetical protein